MESLTRPKWRIYYDDGSVFDSTDGGPDDAPAVGVQCIVEPDEVAGRAVLNSFDWYYFHTDSGMWWGSDLYGMLDKLLNRIPITGICSGRNCKNYREILDRAVADPDFPKKSARVPRETP